MVENCRDWIVQWIKNNSWADEKVINEALDDSIFEAGWIDSIDFIALYSDIEEVFNISFSGSDFEQINDSPTVNNMTKIIEAKGK